MMRGTTLRPAAAQLGRRVVLDATWSSQASLRGWAYALAAICVLNVIASSVLLALFQAKSVFLLRPFILFKALDDSWTPMLDALDQLGRSTAVPLYSQLFFAGGVRFQYPPSSLIFLDALRHLTGASAARLIVLLNRISFCEVFLVGVASCHLFLGAVRQDRAGAMPDPRLRGSPGPSLPPWSALPPWIALASWIALALSFYPLTRGYWLGQAQTTITLLVACALLSWQRGRPALAGVLLGLCCCVKPQWGVVCVWALVRREWSLAAAAGATLAVASLVACAAYGPHQYVDYLSVISFLSRRGESYVANQSMNGLMNRLLRTGSDTVWAKQAFPAFNRIVYSTSMAVTVLLLGFALVWRHRRKATTLDLALVVLSLTMASPIAWEHHYAILLPIFALLLPVCIAERPFGRYSLACLAVAFFLTSRSINEVTDRLAASHANVLQSYLYFGAFVVLVTLYRVTSPSGVLSRGDVGASKAGAFAPSP
jgi:alpha-1,2-mannosyltransferase